VVQSIPSTGWTTMFGPLLPPRADNTYRGHRLALVLFGLLLFVKTAISLGSIFNGRTAASSADGIPIDSYTAAGAGTVVSLFAMLGLSNVMLGVLGWIVLLRYRSLVPLLFVILLVQQVGRSAILQLLPIARTGAPPGLSINLAMLGAMVVGLVLALWARRDAGPVSATRS
jgi:hypothetical protein